MKNRRKALSDILRDSPFTDFEKKVFRVVAGIPRGRTESYGWVARTAGTPCAYRAVGNALNKNRHTDVIPCHRVVRSDGSLGGYARGRARKRTLLESEGVDTRRDALL